MARDRSRRARWAREAQGDRGGVKEILQGLQIFRATGAKIAYTFIMSTLADVFLQRRQYDHARAVVLESLHEVGPKTERVFNTELLRLQGLICLRESGERGFRRNRDALAEEGERHLLDAIAVARKQNARAFVLRATSDLCRLLMGEATTIKPGVCWRASYRGFRRALRLRTLTTPRVCSGPQPGQTPGFAPETSLPALGRLQGDKPSLHQTSP
jgi:hypothetical protein